VLDLGLNLIGSPARDSAPGTLGRDTVAGQDLAGRMEKRLDILPRTGTAAGLYYQTTPDTLVIWLLLPTGDTRVSLVPVSNEVIQAKVDSLRGGLGVDLRCVGDPVRGDPNRLLAELSSILIPAEFRNLLPDSGELVVFPHGHLNRLPFAALEVAPGDTLGVRFAIRYAPSLDVLEVVEEKFGYSTSFSRATSALVVGNPEMPKVEVCGDSITPTRPAGAERSSIYVAAELGVEPLIGAAASEGTVRERLPSSRVIYLATHGYAYDSQQEARRSFITLAPDSLADRSRGAIGHDGILSVQEILDELPNLQAELVVLGACETGLGEQTDGEGTVGLQRALLARGAKSVLVSLWDADDAASAVLLNEFFRRWIHDGVSKAEALRQAQMEVRKHPSWISPRFWAAFQLSGGR
jgi:CHAT domain-containing protein